MKLKKLSLVVLKEPEICKMAQPCDHTKYDNIMICLECVKLETESYESKKRILFHVLPMHTKFQGAWKEVFYKLIDQVNPELKSKLSK